MDTIDTVDVLSPPRARRSVPVSRSGVWRAIFSWVLSWEIYPIVFIATFLRLYQFSATEFDADQAAIFSLARSAVVHGLVPVTTNIASIHILNPPATVYLLMLGAVFSANPAAGVIVISLLNVLAVLFTYIVVRRYYGRLAGSVAGLFYAVAQLAIFYGSFLWNQNLLAPFMPLFLFALFWGVVERRRGWLAPAVLLWGWMIQLHGSAVFLIIPLGLACILAFKTLRWRDIFLAIGLLILAYSPYIVWELTSHFSDLSILLQGGGGKSVIDTKALHGYLDFLVPYTSRPTNPLSLQYKLYGLLHTGYWGMVALTACAFGLTLFTVCRSAGTLFQFVPKGERLRAAVAASAKSSWEQLRSWCAELVATPWRCGLLVLLAWQILPVILLSRHSLRVFDYYMLVLMPGPFILMGIFAAQVVEWLRSLTWPWPLARFAFYLLLLGLALTLSLGSFSRTLDRTDGYNNPSYTYYTLQDTQNAINESDRLAQVYHAKRVYVALDVFTSDALTYLSGGMQTAHTTYEASNCLPLPGPGQGTALMLFGPADWSAETLLTHFTSARLVSAPPRPGGPPFHLYLVQPAASTANRPAFLNNLALASGRLQFVPTSSLLLARWSVLRPAAPTYGTTYSYKLDASFHGHSMDGKSSEDICALSDLQPGEQILTAFSLPSGSVAAPASLSVSGTTWTTTPYNPAYGLFHLETFLHHSTPEVPLRPSGQGTSVTLQG